MAPFDIQRPDRGDVPVLVEVPHAGLDVPESLRHALLVRDEDLKRDADIYVDRLYAFAPRAGATLLVAKHSRYVTDLNRAPDDVDAEVVPDHPAPVAVQPRGVVWRMTTEGRPCLARPLGYDEFQARLRNYHAPYHTALQGEAERLRERFGHVVLLAAHSMPSVGRSGHADRGRTRADIVPGTRGRTSADARIIDMVDAHFRAAGYSVRHDDPYRGGYTTGHYGRPALGCHAIQIEINRALYVDEATFAWRESSAQELGRTLEGLIEKLGALTLS